MMKKKTYKSGGATKTGAKKMGYGGSTGKKGMMPKGPKKMKMGGSTKTKTKK